MSYAKMMSDGRAVVMIGNGGIDGRQAHPHQDTGQPHLPAVANWRSPVTTTMPRPKWKVETSILLVMTEIPTKSHGFGGSGMDLLLRHGPGSGGKLLIFLLE
jgi:hypothetical protein